MEDRNRQSFLGRRVKMGMFHQVHDMYSYPLVVQERVPAETEPLFQKNVCLQCDHIACSWPWPLQNLPSDWLLVRTSEVNFHGFNLPQL